MGDIARILRGEEPNCGARGKNEGLIWGCACTLGCGAAICHHSQPIDRLLEVQSNALVEVRPSKFIGEASLRGRQEMRLLETIRQARYTVGDVVRHRVYAFRGIVFDIDPVFDNTEEWWLSIPEEVRPAKDQPFYHLLAENEETEYIAYVSEQNLLPDDSGAPVHHPKVSELFQIDDEGRYHALFLNTH